MLCNLKINIFVRTYTYLFMFNTVLTAYIPLCHTNSPLSLHRGLKEHLPPPLFLMMAFATPSYPYSQACMPWWKRKQFRPFAISFRYISVCACVCMCVHVYVLFDFKDMLSVSLSLCMCVRGPMTDICANYRPFKRTHTHLHVPS